MYTPRPVPRTVRRSRTRGSFAASWTTLSMLPSSRRWQIVSRSGAAAPATTPGIRSLPTAHRTTSRPSRTSLSSATSILSSRRATASTRSTTPCGSSADASGPQPRPRAAARGGAPSGAPQREHSSPVVAYVRSPQRGQVWYGIVPRPLPLREPTLSRGGEPSAGLGRAERDLGRAQALALEQPPLRLGAPRERGRVDARQPRVLAHEVFERAPQRALALDAEREHLELEHAAVRRVAGDPPVELRAAQLLDRPAGPHLQRVAGDGEARHDVGERRPVLGQLVREALERRLERRAAVRTERAARELQAGGRAGEVVVEVDRDEAAAHARCLPGAPPERTRGRPMARRAAAVKGRRRAPAEVEHPLSARGSAADTAADARSAPRPRLPPHRPHLPPQRGVLGARHGRPRDPRLRPH